MAVTGRGLSLKNSNHSSKELYLVQPTAIEWEWDAVKLSKLWLLFKKKKKNLD